jgi:DNA-directed RNA polymerase subunit RPC12/RpoP
MEGFAIAIVLLGILVWIGSKANSFHEKVEKLARCPYCGHVGGKRIMKGVTVGRHECNNCKSHFNY